jgi:hypothetical protein
MNKSGVYCEGECMKAQKDRKKDFIESSLRRLHDSMSCSVAPSSHGEMSLASRESFVFWPTSTRFAGYGHALGARTSAVLVGGVVVTRAGLAFQPDGYIADFDFCNRFFSAQLTFQPTTEFTGLQYFAHPLRLCVWVFGMVVLLVRQWAPPYEQSDKNWIPR